MGEILHTVGKVFMLVLVPEEARIVKARAEDAFVAAFDQTIPVGIDVHYSHKPVSQLASSINYRKVLLMVAHDRDQNFFRQVEIGKVEFTCYGGWIFGQV